MSLLGAFQIGIFCASVISQMGISKHFWKNKSLRIYSKTDQIYIYICIALLVLESHRANYTDIIFRTGQAKSV